MKASIDALLLVLLIIFAGSFAVVIVYGEVWQIRLPTTNLPIETFDYARSLSAFIASCICATSGASMLYVAEKQFPQSEE